MLTKRDDWVRQLARDWHRAELDPPDRALLDYVEKVTREPWTVKQEDIDALRSYGFTDTAILDACQIAGYYAYVNRMADGLGVELEDLSGDWAFDPLA
jgi:uncharacterized peroxidase-related enzyme